MMIANCALFGDQILLEDCVGVSISGSLIGISIDTTTSPKVNRIADNFVHDNVLDDPSFTFKFSPSTIVQDNCVSNGLWQYNTVNVSQKAALLPKE